MSVVASGVVEVRVRMDADGNAESKIESVARAQKKLVGPTLEAASAGDKLKGAMKGIREGVSPINSIRETTENLRSNLGLVIGTVTGLVGGLVSMVRRLQESGTAMAELKDRAKEFADGNDAMVKGLDAIRAKLGIQKDTFRDTYDAAVIGASTARLEVDVLTRATEETRKKAADMRDMLADAPHLALPLIGFTRQLDELERNAVDLANKRADAISRVAEFERMNVEYMRAAVVEAQKIAAITVMPLAGFYLNDKFGVVPQLGGRAKRTGGGADLVAEWKKDRARVLREIDKELRGSEQERNDRAILRNLERWSPSAEEYTAPTFKQKADAQGRLAEKGQQDRMRSVDSVNAFIGALDENALPGLDKFHARLQAVSDIWKDWAKTGKQTGAAVAGSLGQIALAGSEFLKGEKERAAFQGAVFLLLGGVHVLTPGMETLGAAELINGAALLAKAGGAGGGGGRGRGASAGTGAGRSVQRVRGESATGGGVMMVFNGPYYGGHSAQEAGEDFVRISRAGRGTGFGRWD